MAMRFRILGSSSSGNCALLTTGECKVLIDAGFSGRRIQQMLESVGESIADIDAVFLTHEHSDHCQGLRGLAKFSHLKVFANRPTAEACQRKLTRQPAWQVFETGREFIFRDLRVLPFDVPHDATEPVGFVIESGEDDLFSPLTRLAWLTDLGYVPHLVREHVRTADLLMVEANHDPQLLDQCESRPWPTKQRIRGRHGHLSNEACFDFLRGMERPRWQEVCLGHVSKECNDLAMIERSCRQLHEAGARFGLHVIDPEGGVGEDFALGVA